MFKKMFFSALTCICLLIVAITVSYAWYITKESEDFKSPLITGKSSAAYYESGDGSKEKPFIISNKRHFYNFAWLQYLGTYNQKDKDNDGTIKQYYFKLKNDIDCEGLVLPPIGTTKYPFVGNFNGNGKTIYDYKTTNVLSQLNQKPSKVTSLDNCSIVGTFGVVGKYEGMVNENLTISSTVNEITNFNLDNAFVNSSGQTLVGIIAGYVNGNVSNVGVHYANISLLGSTNKISTFENISNFTLIGDYDDTLISWEDKPNSSNDSGANQDFGGTLDFKNMYTRMGLMNKYSWAFPTLTYDVEKFNTDQEGNSYSTGIFESALTNKSYMPLVVDNKVDDNYYKNNTSEKTNSSNIGYLTGDSATLEKSPLKDMIDDSYIIRDENGEITSVRIFSIKEENHQKIHSEVTSSIDKDIMNKIISFCSDDYLYGVRFTAQISHNQPVTINNAVVDNTVLDSIDVPNSSIWFKPLVSGTAKIVSYRADSTRSLSFYEIDRTSNNPFSTSVVNGEVYMNGNEWHQTFYYFEAEVEAGKEYAIGSQNGSDCAHFIYLDIGQNAGSALPPSEDPEITYGAIESVDFVYLKSDGTLLDITDDTYSAIFFQISGTTTGLVEYYFRRNNDTYTGAQDVVLFYPKNDTTKKWTTVSGKTSDGDNTIAWSYAGSKALAGKNEQYKEVYCEVLGTKVSGGITNTNTGTSSKCTVAYVYKDLETNEYVTISKGAVTKGSAITEPSFNIIGYNIVGWYSDAALSTAYNFAATAVNSNITIYAKVEKVDVNTVTFKDDTDNSTITSIQVNENGTVSITDPRKESYIFDAWYTRVDNGDGSFTYTKIDDLSALQITEDITLYAKWNDAWNVEYVYNVGSGDVLISDTEVAKGGTLTQPADPVLDRYKFKYWYTITDNGDGTTTETQFSFDTTITSNMTIYAKFEAIEYHYVTFYDEDGTTVIYRIEVEDGTPVTKPVDPTKSDGIFIGWYTDNIFAAEFDFSANIEDDTSVYANFQDALTVTFTYNDGINDIVVSEVAVLENEKVEKPADPTRTGYKFNGWYSDSTCQTAFDFAKTITADTIIYADWIKLNTVTFEYNDTTSTVYVEDNSIIPTNDIPQITYNTQTQYYEWYLTSASGTKLDLATYTITDDTTIVAVIKDKYVVTFIADGEIIKTIYKLPTETVLESEAPAVDSNAAYTIEGWYINDSYETSYTFGSELDETTEIYAKINKKITINFSVTYNGQTTVTEVYRFTGGTLTSSDIDVPQTTDNYFITGWTNSSGNAVDTFEIIEGVTYTAVVVNKYKVTLDANGGSIIGDTVLTTNVNGEVTLPEATNGNATFVGWSDGQDTHDAGVYEPTGDITLTAVWTYATSVTFDANGGTFSDSSTTTSVTLDANGIISGTLPTDPTREEYVFTGWYLDSQCSIELDTLEPITVDTIYAGWESANLITLKVDVVVKGQYNNEFKGAIFIDSTYNIASKESVMSKISSLLSTVNVTGNYEISNIYTGYLSGEITEFPATLSSTNSQDYDAYISVLLTEKVGEPCTITFETNGGSTINTQTIYQGSTVSKPLNPTKLGYVFAGWYSDENLSTVFNFLTPITEDTTIYAKWVEEKTVAINYVEDGNTITETIKVAAGDSITLPSDVANEYYITSISGGYSEGSTLVVNDDIELTINKITIYSVTVDYGNGITETVYTNESYLVTLTEPTNGTATFAGWYVGENSIDISTYTIKTTSVTITAKWIYNSTITFYVDEVEYHSTSTTTGTISLPEEPTKDGYLFLGWYNGEIKIDSNTVFKQDTIVIAKWKKQYTITFVYDNDITADLVLTTNMNGKIDNFPADPTYEGHKFLGWYIGSTQITSDTIFTSEEQTLTAYARWIEAYTVTFDSNGGSTVEQQVVESGSLATQPTNPTKSGYKFAGWYLDLNDPTSYDFSTAITGNITLIAKWEDARNSKTYNLKCFDYDADGNSNNPIVTIEFTVYYSGSSPTVDELNAAAPQIEGYTFVKFKWSWGDINNDVLGWLGANDLLAIYSAN